ncbi:hypothetical protein DH2020_007025 [Rehmannia glutinosa]|uniref:Protein kinase domain-containing protein n=1 Tax=Rehmannia glutinosa TaxID=99300 RepID=A0ABR0TWP4_REHGL
MAGSLPSDTCNNLPNLKSLYLWDNKLEGQIPPNIYKCRDIEILALSVNHFNGEIPSEIGSLSKLRELYLGANNLKGPIPKQIGNCTSLKVLTLSNNYLTGRLPSDICNNLPNLKTLYVSGNQLEGQIPPNICKCRNIEHLALSINHFTGKIPSEIGSLSMLKELYLGYNDLKGPIPKQIGNCTSLKVLTLSNNYLTGEFPQELCNLAVLERLTMFNNSLSGFIPSSIFNISTLKSLELSMNHFSGSLRLPWNLSFSNLEKLYLHTNGLTGEIPSSITNASKLTILELSENSFSGSIPDFGNLRLLQRLNMWKNNLSGSTESPNQELGFISSLTNCQNLTFLEISENPLNGVLPASIGNLSTSLQMLRASGCNIKGVIPDGIGNLSSLLRISLSQNELTGLISPTIGKLMQLQRLYLSGNRLQGYVPPDLCRLSNIGELDLSENDLTGSIPECLGNLESLRAINLGSNKLNSSIPSNLWNLRDLLFLNLSLNSLSGQLSPEIASLKVINGIDLSSNQLSSDIPRSIDGCQSLQFLSLSNNKFEGSIPESLGNESERALIRESEILSTVRHRNLVRIIGCCTNTEFKALILGYMPNGSLEKWLYSDNYFLDLLQRLNIAIDVALALEYLHHGHTFPVVHCDIKPNNVLLDEDMTAHLGDFGIAKLFDEGETMVQTKTLATIGYAAPEYGSGGRVSTNGDVYSYGILLLEIFTKKKPTNDMFNEEMSLKDWVHEALQENNVTEIVAPDLLVREDQHLCAKEECVSSVFSLAMECLALLPEERTNMIQIVAALQRIKAKVVASPKSNSNRRRNTANDAVTERRSEEVRNHESDNERRHDPDEESESGSDSERESPEDVVNFILKEFPAVSGDLEQKFFLFSFSDM